MELGTFAHMLQEIKIKKGKESSLYRQHPWVFSGAISNDCSHISDGALVRVVDSRGQFLASGHYQNGSISVRILSFSNEEIDGNFYNGRILAAIQLRKNLGLLSKKNQIFRLCHGEGDGLPGLVIDYYHKVAVVQCHSIGMVKQIDEIKEALIRGLGKDLKAIYLKSAETLPKRFEIKDGYIHGVCETPHLALENGITYAIDWINGQKTGFFIDQRDSRKLLGSLSNGKKVLNAFCYSGGFSLQALAHGASHVISVDSSKKALELTDANLKLNDFKGTHDLVLEDVMNYLKELPQDLDIVVLDPPAFAKHREKRHNAIQGYKRLNALAMKQMKSGSLLVTFSCSQVVDKTLFTHTIVAAAIEAKRKVQILYQLHQPADHPIGALHPEGEYLKGLVLHVE